MTKAITLLIIIITLCGCSPKVVYLPSESITERTDTIFQIQRIVERDTITKTERIVESRLDSIAPILDSVGKMIGYDRWHIIDRSSELKEENSRLRALIDSLEKKSATKESNKEPYPVERQLSKWERLKMDFGGLAMGGIIGILAIALIWLIKRQK